MTVKFGLAPLSNKHLSDSSLPCLAATKDKAQNGHKSVVKMLLDRHKRLAYVENDMHLNAFNLAVENDHFEIYVDSHFYLLDTKK
jgi:hypothetical protein